MSPHSQGYHLQIVACRWKRTRDCKVHGVGDFSFAIPTNNVQGLINEQSVHQPSTANFKTQKVAIGLFSLKKNT
jgi:hypothetical protein